MIHYHGTPFSGGILGQRALKGRHAFISFATQENVEQIIELTQSFAFDNGAFTSWKQDTEFDMDGYAEWVTKWHRHPGFDFYCLPDCIDGDHHDNQLFRSRWFNAVGRDVWAKGWPVFHLHEPLEILTSMMQAYPGICLGSSGDYAEIGTVKWWGRMGEIMRVVTDDEGRPLVKLHGLRMLDPSVFSHLPLSSADSTNVARNAGTDSRWNGTYAPRSSHTRALILMERIEDHASAARWSKSMGAKNYELFG